jgi:hypothetical protein
MTNNELYSAIEAAIIRWNLDGTKTAGSLTREIMLLIKNYEMEKDVFGELAERIKKDIDSQIVNELVKITKQQDNG